LVPSETASTAPANSACGISVFSTTFIRLTIAPSALHVFGVATMTRGRTTIGLRLGIALPCAAGDASGSLAMVVNPVGGAVTLVCKARLTVTSSMTLTKISITAGTQPVDQTICLNTKTCTGSFPLGTTNVVAQFFGTAPFHYVCPGDIAPGNYYDVTHTITVGQCTVASLSASSVIPFTP
jgi:hypothetical protein